MNNIKILIALILSLLIGISIGINPPNDSAVRVSKHHELIAWILTLETYNAVNEVKNICHKTNNEKCFQQLDHLQAVLKEQIIINMPEDILNGMDSTKTPQKKSEKIML